MKNVVRVEAMSKCFYFLHLILSTYSTVVLQSLNKYCRNEEWIINSSWLIFVLVADVLKIVEPSQTS